MRRQQSDERTVLAVFTAPEVLAALRHTYPERIVITPEHVRQGLNVYARWTDEGMAVTVGS